MGNRMKKMMIGYNTHFYFRMRRHRPSLRGTRMRVETSLGYISENILIVSIK